MVRVRDTGIGLNPDMLSRAFDLFTQENCSTDRSKGGLGIGLTLVRGLVELHGGNVTAESSGIGTGSTFTVRLPLGTCEPLQPAVPPAKESESAGPLEVLIVDDNRDAAESLQMLLEMKGHSVRLAHDGPEAIRALDSFRPGLILLDLGLPGMSGYEIARWLRENPAFRNVRLVALTGWGQEGDRQRTKAAGFDDHLVKPPEFQEIEKILAQVSEGRRRSENREEPY